MKQWLAAAIAAVVAAYFVLVSDSVQRQLETGIPAVDLRDARNVVDSLRDDG